jgi:hypothetical protein
VNTEQCHVRSFVFFCVWKNVILYTYSSPDAEYYIFRDSFSLQKQLKNYFGVMVQAFVKAQRLAWRGLLYAFGKLYKQMNFHLLKPN